MTVGEVVFIAGLIHLGLALLYGLYLQFDIWMHTRRMRRELRQENEAFRAWAEALKNRDYRFAAPDESEEA